VSGYYPTKMKEIMDEQIAEKLYHEGAVFAKQLRRLSDIAVRGRKSIGLRTSLKQDSENALDYIGLKELWDDVDVNTILENKEDGESPQVDVEPFVQDPIFESKFAHEEMRCLALVAHNHMKPAMKEFVIHNLNLFKKFRLTGTGITMIMLREILGEEHMNKYGGPVCKSGPLGGDAKLVAQMCAATMGAIFFFQDPMDAHPHTADIECLNRQTNVHNIIVCTNPSSAHAMTFALRQALRTGETSMVPALFFTCESPSVKEYKDRQAAVIVQNRGSSEDRK
jgi:methylglyoxal synthase